MPTVTLSPLLKQKFFANSGVPLNGGKLFVYLPTTTTKTTTYTDSTGGTPNANPVLLDYRGEADVWIEPNKGYKFVLAPSTDTDPPTNPIWSEDNVRSSQLITLYGGVDTGVVNAYVLTFAASFTGYADGTVVYWIPANTNTGPSTININGIGIANIINQDGTALLANQLFANQVATTMAKGGAWLLISSGIAASVSSGTFAPSWTGFGGAPPTGNMAWQVVGKQATLEWLGTTGTSTGTFMTIGNVPSNLRPTSKSLLGMGASIVVDNNNRQVGSVGHGALGVLQFNMGTPLSGTGFTNVGTKGLDLGWTWTYLLS